jgi:tetratricopeptide (TPR) repeat protein
MGSKKWTDKDEKIYREKIEKFLNILNKELKTGYVDIYDFMSDGYFGGKSKNYYSKGSASICAQKCNEILISGGSGDGLDSFAPGGTSQRTAAENLLTEAQSNLFNDQDAKDKYDGWIDAKSGTTERERQPQPKNDIDSFLDDFRKNTTNSQKDTSKQSSGEVGNFFENGNNGKPKNSGGGFRISWRIVPLRLFRASIGLSLVLFFASMTAANLGIDLRLPSITNLPGFTSESPPPPSSGQFQHGFVKNSAGVTIRVDSNPKVSEHRDGKNFLHRGAYVRTTQTKTGADGNEWKKISFDTGKEGWIRSAQVEWREGSREGWNGYVNGTSVILRPGAEGWPNPAPRSSLYPRLDKNAAVKVIESVKNLGNEKWLYVEYGGRKGWLRSDYVNRARQYGNAEPQGQKNVESSAQPRSGSGSVATSPKNNVKEAGNLIAKGDALMRQGNSQQALEAYKRALALNPSNQAAETGRRNAQKELDRIAEQKRQRDKEEADRLNTELLAKQRAQEEGERIAREQEAERQRQLAKQEKERQNAQIINNIVSPLLQKALENALK